MTQQQTWAVICGLVRDPIELLDKIKTLRSWHDEGIIHGIVFSTWLNELDTHGLRSQLEKEGVLIVETRQPQVSLDGNVFPQMITLYNGLQLCPDNSRVLKLRVDKCSLVDVVKHALQKPHPQICSDILNDWPSPYESKIIMHSGLMLQPLFLCDIFYIGKKEDLLKFISFDLSPDIFSLRIFAEQILHYNVLAKTFPIFRQFYQINVQYLHADPEFTPKLIQSYLSNDFMLEVLATYFLILRKYYQIGFMPQHPSTANQWTSKLNELSYSQFFDPYTSPELPAIGFHPGNLTLWFYDDYWIDSLLNGSLKMDLLGERFLAAVERAKLSSNQQMYSGSMLDISPSAFKLAQIFKTQFSEITDFSLEDYTTLPGGSRKIIGRNSQIRK